MKKLLTTILLLIILHNANAQKSRYKNEIAQYQKQYVANHEVVKGKDKALVNFFDADAVFRVSASFKPVQNAPWFKINTSSGKTKDYRQYGQLTFTIHDSVQTLYIYQSQALLQSPEHWDHLFLPFTDKTTGDESYEAGRYIDFKISDIKNNRLVIDFNKAYNPYCAYVSGMYSCPVPPAENKLTVAIKAGEKKFAKAH